MKLHIQIQDKLYILILFFYLNLKMNLMVVFGFLEMKKNFIIDPTKSFYQYFYSKTSMKKWTFIADGNYLIYIQVTSQLDKKKSQKLFYNIVLI